MDEFIGKYIGENAITKIEEHGETPLGGKLLWVTLENGDRDKMALKSLEKLATDEVSDFATYQNNFANILTTDLLTLFEEWATPLNLFPQIFAKVDRTIADTRDKIEIDAVGLPMSRATISDLNEKYRETRG